MSHQMSFTRRAGGGPAVQCHATCLPRVHSVRPNKTVQQVPQQASFSGRVEPSRLAGGCHSTDYTASVTDEGVLLLPSRTELEAEQVTNVFGYPRNLQDKYRVGRVIGAGSFGVVRECLEKSSQRLYAVKTVPKVRGCATRLLGWVPHLRPLLPGAQTWNAHPALLIEAAHGS
jgi:hypothetical protein